MVDKKANQDEIQDEYQFDDLDITENESEDGDDSVVEDVSSTQDRFNKKDVIRNALIVLGVVIVAMVVYKFVGSMFSTKEPVVKAPVAAIKPAMNPVPAPQPIAIQETPSPEMLKKISALEVSQGTLSSDVNNLNTQVSAITTNLNDLNTKIAQLTQTINTLAAQVSQQSQQIAALSVRARPTPRHYVNRQPHMPAVYYYIQAVIPGRAWLVSSQGLTVTVREGTSVPGYGIVKLIDPNQGRILTSSGRTITFSQQDS